MEGEDEDEVRIYEFTLRVPSGRRDASDYLHLSFFEPLVPWHERTPEWLHMMQEGTLVEVTPPDDSIQC